MINESKILEYITIKNFVVDYSIKNEENIYAMHSVGKIFTGILVMLFLKYKIISETTLLKPIELPNIVMNKLSQKVQTRLKETTFYDCMTRAGLKDYLENYVKYLGTKDSKYIYEPEDFIQFADKDVLDHENYSNLGMLLVGISLKHIINIIRTLNHMMLY